MVPETTKKFLRELIRELIENDVGYNELKGFLNDAVNLSFKNPEEALRISEKHLEQLENEDLP